MFAAVHADRSGRIVLASDYRAAGFDGASTEQLEAAIRLPKNAELVPLADRIAVAIDRTGHIRELGQGRFAVAAVLPIGHVRLLHPAFAEPPGGRALEARPYAAVAADERGDLFAAGAQIEAAAALDRRADPSLSASVSEWLRTSPSNRVVRQLARCAREYHCRAATNAFFGTADAAIPIAAPTNENPPPVVSFYGAEARPTERAQFSPSPEEIAQAATAHFERGGTIVAFGRACEGEPLLAARTLEVAIAAIRERTRDGTVHVESNGSAPAAIGRLARAGLDSIAVRIASARSDTYERIHRPVGYRLSDVRASIAEAVAAKLRVSLLVLLLPGLSDQEREVDATIALAGELPSGSDILLRDLGADPYGSMAIVPSGESPIGIERFIDRIRGELAHLRLGSLSRPLART